MELMTSDPTRYRSSILAGRYWCDEQMRLKVIGEIMNTDDMKPASQLAAASEGTRLHEELYNTARRYPWEEEFLTTISEYMVDDMGFVRKFHGIELFDHLTGHPDDFQVTPSKKVSVVEYKTVASDNEWWRKFILATAKIQAAVLYPYIMEPIIYRLGYEIADTHAVIFYDRSKDKVIDYRTFKYSPEASELFLEECFEIIRGERETIQPRKHKCYMCPIPIMLECTFYKARRVKPSKRQQKEIAERKSQQ